MQRRAFIKGVLVAGGAAALDSLFAGYGQAQVLPTALTPYGPLRPVADVDATRTALALPPGFQYRIVSIAGRTMSDGNVLPANGDGMAAFADGGFIRLVRNHERTGPGLPIAAAADHYDRVATGGTVTAVIDPATRSLVRDFVSLSGTAQNCFGGRTPWGSWLSGEETTVGGAEGFEKAHGYIFEVPAAADRPVAPVPLTDMGRFVHEAAIVDPRTSVVYLTEDAGSCGFYRFVPDVPGALAAGGRLQMLAVKGWAGYDTITGQRAGDRLPVAWVDIRNPDPAITPFDQQPVFRQGRDGGGARFRRLEGAAYVNGDTYFISTTGGDRALGQLWRYRPVFSGVRRRLVGGSRIGFSAPEAAGELTLIYESRDPELLRLPDNICPTPNGGLVICEDSGEPNNRIRILSPRGDLFDFAANILPGEERSELCGPTFSPDGQTLFFNIYSRAMTIAVWGPWGSDLL